MPLDKEDAEKRQKRLIGVFEHLKKKKLKCTDWEIYFITHCWGDLKYETKEEFDKAVAEFKEKGLIDTSVMTKDSYEFKEKESELFKQG